jgi:hypothetical protein
MRSATTGKTNEVFEFFATTDLERVLMPQPSFWRRFGGCLLLVGLLPILPACSRNEEGEPVPVNKVSGKITYQGKPVPCGLVVFYSVASIHGAQSKVMPSGHGIIKDGTYEVSIAPTGPVKVCVVTDPDTDPFTFLLPTDIGAKGGPKGGPPRGPGGPQGGPGGPKGGGPGGPEGGPGGPQAGPPAKGFNPMTANLTSEQKMPLRSIHEKYSDFIASTVVYEVKQGDQRFDLVLD